MRLPLIDAPRRADRCAAGHPYDAANTYVTPSGKRLCRACRYWRARARRLRREG